MKPGICFFCLYYLLAVAAVAQTPAQTIVYSTYIEGTYADFGTAVAADASGNSYVTGNTQSVDFPRDGQGFPAPACTQQCVFVTKFNATGGLVYSRVLGGTGMQWAAAIAADSAGNAYVIGRNTSTDFPLLHPFQTDVPNLFLAKFDATGTLVYSTQLSGFALSTGSVAPSNAFAGIGIAVDAAGSVYLAGVAAAGGTLVEKLNPAQNGIVFSATIPGSGVLAQTIAVDSGGNIYVAGQTDRTLVTLNPLQASPGTGVPTGFVAKLDAKGALVYATYLGGSKTEYISSIGVDASGSPIVCGFTTSTDFPVKNAIQPQISGTMSGFVARLNASGSALTYATYLPASGGDQCRGLGVDAAGNAYVGEAGLVLKLSAAGQIIESTTWYGKAIAALASDGLGQAYLVGSVGGTLLPLMNPFQANPNGPYVHAFAAKLSDTPPASCATFVAPGPVTLGFTLSGTGTVQATTLITTNGPNCPWQITGIPSRITITPSTSGIGTTLVTITAPVNTGPVALTAILQIGTQSLTVTSLIQPQAILASASGAPGQVARVPVDLYITPSLAPFSMFVNITVSANGGAPPVTSPLGFQGNTSLPALKLALNGVTVSWSNMYPRPTGKVHLGELLISIPATAAYGQTYTVTATGGSLGGDSPNIIPTTIVPAPAVQLAVSNPIPRAIWMLPSSAAPGSPPVNVTIYGEGFTNASTVTFNGTAVATTFVSESQLQATIPVAATGSIAVINPTPGGGTSNTLAFVVTANPPPAVGANAVVGAADYTVRLAGGGLASLFGTNLASSTQAATAIPLPTSLGGTMVLIDGIPAPLVYASATQINFQLPWRTVTQTQANLVVTVNGVTSLQTTIPLQPVAPAIFTLNSQGSGQGAIQDTLGNFVAPLNSVPGRTSQPGAIGQVISIFCTGLGADTDNLVDGTAVLNNPFQPGNPSQERINAIATVTATIGGLPAEVSFAGLAPGFVGLYQVNVAIPAGVQSGSAIPVQISANGVLSNTVTIAIR